MTARTTKELHEPSQRLGGLSAAIVVAAVTVLVQLPAVPTPFGGDDVYILANLSSPRWADRLFAINLDAPTAEYMPWWFGVVTQRRFVRIPASLLLWIQWALFGGHAPVAHHLVSLAILASCCALIALALRRWVPWPAAVLSALVPGVHPASAEIVGTVNCQPLATAGLFSVLTFLAWAAMRRRASMAYALAATVLCALAVTSYEAAVALPLVLVLADRGLLRGDERAAARWVPRVAVMATLLVQGAITVWMRRGLVAPDTSAPRPWTEIARTLRVDGVEFGVKAMGILDPFEPLLYVFQQRLGEAIGLAVALALLGGIAWGVRKTRMGWLGLAAFFLFLAAPLVMRAVTSRFNLPTLRQIYLPVLMGLPLLAGAVLGRARGRWLTVAAMSWVAVLASEAVILGRFRKAIRVRMAQEASIAAALEGAPGSATLIGIGDACGFPGSHVWTGPSVLAIPEEVGGEAPELVALDAHTILARAARGFGMPTRVERTHAPPGPNRGVWEIDRFPPPAVTRGWQRIVGATVSVEERTPDAVTSLRYRFDRPLSDLVFLHYRGCGPARRLWPSGEAPR